MKTLRILGMHGDACAARGELMHFVHRDDWLLLSCRLAKLLQFFVADSAGLAFAPQCQNVTK
jgi:hypothetical protein